MPTNSNDFDRDMNFEDLFQNRVVCFGTSGDWLVMSVGHYEGSGGYFFGSFYKMKKDGSEFA